RAVGSAVPAIPALSAQVHDRRRVAIELGYSDAAREVIGPVALGHMAARAGLCAATREALIEEQERAELDRVRFSGDSIGRIGPPRSRPRPVGQDGLDFALGDPGRDTLVREADPGRQRQAGCAENSERDARRVEAGATGP